MWPFCTTLSAILFSILSTLKPGVVLFSTMKPLTWLSATSRAQMMETSHQVALPIHRFSPLRIQVSPSRFAVVVSPPEAPEPTSGSVSPKQPTFSNRAIGGGHLSFCSSHPPWEIEPLPRPAWPSQHAAEDRAAPALST